MLDFGLGRLRPTLGAESIGSQAQTTSAITDPGVVLGTVGYMSPEQVLGQSTDPRSDVFSFGAMPYEMLGLSKATGYKVVNRFVVAPEKK